MAPQSGDNPAEAEAVNFNDDTSIQFGKLLTRPEPGEEVVISGLSGSYPASADVYEYRDNLFNKADMVSADSSRWEPGHPEVPQRTGKIPNIERFDAGYFGVHHRQATTMDPMMRHLLEKAVEAIFDAGLQPSDLEGTNTGVFIGTCFIETEKTWFLENLIPQGFAITGCQHSSHHRRISYFLKLTGPSAIVDTACSSSLSAIETAYRSIRLGLCDRAIVGGANLCLHPYLSLQFARLGVLSMDGTCKVFDKDGNGYVRSEAISCLMIQKASEAKRVYATILHAKTNCDGYKDSGINFPSREMQVRLLKEFYEECDPLKASDLSFLEAHGTGTKVGDPEELQAIEEVFLPGRTTPLLVGSVKSNIGHTEPSSGLCSATKVIIAFETGYIPPNMHYKTPRPNIKSLEEGRLQVVGEKMPFRDNRGLIGMSSFGFGGANCHVLLKHNPKQKVNNGRPKDNIPRLVCVSGRTKEALDVLFDDVIVNNGDAEHIRLLQDIFRKHIVGHPFRGFSLVAKSGEICRSVNYTADRVPTLVVSFGILDDEIMEVAHELLEIPPVAITIQRIQEVLSTKGINISEVLSKVQGKTILETVLANLTLQVIFADVLKALHIVPDKVFGINKGLSLGTLVAAYFDEALTLKEVIECAYVIAFAANSVSTNGGPDDKELKALIEKSGNVAIQLQQILTKILGKPRKLSKKVIFEVTPSEISSLYLMSSFACTRVLSDVKKTLPENFVIFEVGNGTINTILKKDFYYIDENKFVNIKGGLTEFLVSFGRLYELGFNPQIQELFPRVNFPVSRGTPMISPKVRWSHNRQWFITRYLRDEQLKVEERTVSIVILEPTIAFIQGHNIDGRILFPATGYLMLAWETLAYVHGFLYSDMRVVFENVKFMRACTVSKEGAKLDLTVMVQRGSGNFEITHGDLPVVTGRMLRATKEECHPVNIPVPLRELHAPTMNTKDIYKELKLRGYNYRGKFRALKSCDLNREIAEIAWEGNWVTFMDNMLQVKILQEDTRLLYVPTTIQRLKLDSKMHLEYVKLLGEKPVLPCYVSKETNIVRCGAIEIRGLNATSIARRKNLGTPVLEKYVFVPNTAKLSTEQAVRVNMQILLENLYSIKVKAVELIDEATSEESKPLGELVYNVLADQPLIKPDITILSKTEMEIKNVNVEDKKLLTEVDCSLVVGSKILQRRDILQLALGSCKEKGFMLSREPLDFDFTPANHQEINLITVFTTDEEKLILFRKNSEFKTPTVIKISSEDKEFTWLPQLKRTEKDADVLVYAQGEPLNGLLGLVSCIRREPGGQNMKLVFLPDSTTPEFDLTESFYQEQLRKNLSINIFKDGHWGTYRHLLLEQGHQIQAEHCYLNSRIKGDLSSLSWIEGRLTTSDSAKSANSDETLCSIYYASVNFRDVMIASGRVNVDAVTRNRREQECVQGFEFSGRTQDGKRVMGMTTSGACASLVLPDRYLVWDIPENWSMADAATVPTVYGTSLYALTTRGRVKRGDTVLIHSGTGGVGQAAINLALYFGCTVYTTVGTPEKREFLKKRFPQLTDKNIANSRDTTFEEHVMRGTNGRGVDIVLNSLAEEKLMASIRCLAKGGRFLEIGKFDLFTNNRINLLLLEKEASFHGIMLDALFTESSWRKTEIYRMVQDAIDHGAIRPLVRTIFQMDNPEEVYRYMGSGKHIGKVIFQIRTEEKEKLIKPPVQMFTALPIYYCNEDKTYIICGGLGGFGLELADWLVLRGCKKLILSSRSGIRNGYQTYRISIWNSYGCKVQISTEDITTYEGCKKLIDEANELGPVHGIFNLAVVLKDALLENQTEETYKISFGPKAYATEYLDQVTRKWCPELRDFVVFSSVSCGRGNPGQTNYGMANSVMERICEKRRAEGFPALAIEWGAVGDVGLVAEMQEESIEMEIGGTLQQRITNCLECMDTFLKQNEAAVVSSIVVAEKRAGAGGADNIVDAVANILGVKDLKCISLQATLAEVGMDSMTAVEIKQTLEREYEVFLTAQDIKSLTFARLIEIQAEKDAENQSGVKKERPLAGMDMILRAVGDANIADIPVFSLKGKKSNNPRLKTIVLFPGIEGISSVLEPLYKNLEGDLVGLQYPNDTQKETIEETATTYLPIIEERISKSEPFNFIAHSYGGAIAIEAVHQLEKKGYLGTLILIDTSPDYLKGLTTMIEVHAEDKFQVGLLVQLMSLLIPYDSIVQHLEALMKCNDFEARMNLAQSIVGPDSAHSPEYQRAFAISCYKRVKSLAAWSPDFKLKSQVVLCKPTLVSIHLSDDDYGLSKICEQPVKVDTYDGNHVSVLENDDLSSAIHEILGIVDPPQVSKKADDLEINVEKEQSQEALRT